MTKCGHVRDVCRNTADSIDLLLPLHPPLYPAIRHSQGRRVSHLRRYDPRGHAQERAVS
jgi:hypothetical protein